MKIRSFFLLSLIAFAYSFTVYACQKEKPKENPLNESANGAATERAYDIHNITCSGSCKNGEHPEPSESTCDAMLYDGNTGTIECPCADCSMQVSKEALAKISTYTKYFNEFLMTKIGTVKATLYSVSIEAYTKAEVVVFEFKIPETGAKETVMYITKFDGAGEKGGPTVEVDCSGGCDDAGQTCRERYILATGDAECTCQGSCKLTVTYKD